MQVLVRHLEGRAQTFDKRDKLMKMEHSIREKQSIKLSHGSTVQSLLSSSSSHNSLSQYTLRLYLVYKDIKSLPQN